MTKDINADVLAEAIKEQGNEKFRKEFRDWLVFSAPPDVLEVFNRYTQKMQELDESERANRKRVQDEYLYMMGWFRFWAYALTIGAILFSSYQIYELLTLTNCAR
jgi:hypothetical protein